MTLSDLLRKQARERGKKTFLFFQSFEVTYEKLDSLADSIGYRLLDLGLRRPDSVAVWLPNCPEFLYSWFGITRMGGSIVPINPALKEREVRHILADSQAKAIITTADSLGTIESSLAHLPRLKHRIVCGEGGAAGTRAFRELLEARTSSITIPLIDPEDLCAIVYTSGTTGAPKGAMLSHRNYISNARQLVRAARMTEQDRFLCILPLFHVNAQVVTTLAPMAAGGSMVLMERFSPSELLEALARYQATAFSAVPTVYAILNQLPDAGKYDLSKLRFCICGAAPMPLEVFQTFEKKFHARILEGYGLTEGTCASTVNPLEGKRKVGSIGVPLEDQEVRIVDDRDQVLPLRQVGEIVVRGPNVMRGYFRNPQATAQAIREGWLRTGDLGYRDEEGYFTIVGRKKEMIIRGGENIYPKEIEEVLYQHPKILESAVFGIPDPTWGEEVAACIVLKPGETLTEQEVREYCSKNLADFKRPRKILFRDSLPKTPTGKVQKHLLQAEGCK